MKRLLKAARLILHAAAFVLIAGCVHLLPLTDRIRRLLSVHLTSFFSKCALKILGLRHTLLSPQHPPESFFWGLIVSNHVSYLDVLVLSAFFPAVFITSMEIKRTPILGLLCRLGGCFFVDRQKPVKLRRERPELEKLLRAGFRVVVFPEATSSDGTCVLPFKKALLASALSANVPVFPVCLNYAPPAQQIFYFGDHGFFKHLWQVLAIEDMRVELTALQRVSPAGYTSGRQLGDSVHKMIADVYCPAV